jgi:hypothetical protein
MKNQFNRCFHFLKKHSWHLLTAVMIGYLLWPAGSNINFPQPVISESMLIQAINRDESMRMMESSTAPRMAKMSAPRMSGMVQASDGFAPEASEQKIVKNASISLETKDTEVARVQIEDKIKNIGGQITNVNSWTVRPEVLGYNLQVRVPAEKLDQTLIDVSKLGSKQSENISVTDITSQYQDTENQIKNLEIRRDRLRAMMERDTDKLADVLAIDRELWSVQNQIENMTRTQQGRDRDVTFSQLNISLQPEPRIGDTDNPEWSVKSSWRQAVNKLIVKAQDIADKALQLVVFTPIWLPVLAAIIFVRRKFFKKIKQA